MEIEKSIDNYSVIKNLGSGAFGKVKLVRCQKTGSLFALKMVKKNVDYLEREANFMLELGHANIIKVLAFNKGGEYKKIDSSSSIGPYMVMELAEGGLLFDYIIHSSSFREEIVRFYFSQLIEGLEYCHAKSIVHRDLKLENLLLDKDYNLKISDFGFAASIHSLLKTTCGTPYARPPEINEGDPSIAGFRTQKKLYYGPPCDIFSCGVILFILLFGNYPFRHAWDTCSYYKLLMNSEFGLFWQKHQSNKIQASPQFKDLFERLVHPDPNQRPTIEFIKSHPWYNGPLARMEDIIEEFEKRRPGVEKGLLKERDDRREKKRLIRQSEFIDRREQNFYEFAINLGSLIYAGLGGFRGVEQDQEQDPFADLVCEYPKLKNKRTLKVSKTVGINHLISDLDADYLFPFLVGLLKKEFEALIKLKDDVYKIESITFGSQDVDLTLVTEIYKTEEDTLILGFTKKQGDYIDFEKIVAQIKALVGKKEEEFSAKKEEGKHVPQNEEDKRFPQKEASVASPKEDK